MVVDLLSTELRRYQFTSDVFRLSGYLAEQAEDDYRHKPFDEQLWAAMSEGDKLRQRWERDDALALHAISDIVATREDKTDSTVEDCPGQPEPANLVQHAYILRSLKTPDELWTLRAVYGPRLVVIGAYSPYDKRLEHLAERIEESRHDAERANWTYHPEQLIERDEKEEQSGGQDLSGTFHRADFFIRAWDRKIARQDLRRVIEILFGEPFRTPTRDEYGQFMAAGAARRSAELGRQVGAAIATAEGSVLALGTNEVPRFGGGSHWEEDGTGNRDFEIDEQDTNRKHLDELVSDVGEQLLGTLDQLIEQGAVRDKEAQHEADQRDEVKQALASLREKFGERLPGDLRAGGLKHLTEFGRAVHAEMDALLDAARRGVSVSGATAYTTTFPCHNCARHLIAAGIRRVVFIEPYTKSRAEELHQDAIAIARSNPGQRLSFEPFVGVAPRRYLEIFDAEGRAQLGHVPRRDDEGRKQTLDRSTALPVFADAGLAQFRPKLPAYRAKELLALDHFNHLTADGAEGEAEPADPGDRPDTHDHDEGQSSPTGRK